MGSILVRQKLIFGLTLLIAGGLAKLWVTYETVWAPVLLIFVVFGLGLLLYALVGQSVRHTKTSRFDPKPVKTHQSSMGGRSAFNTQADRETAVETEQEFVIDLGNPYHDPRQVDCVSDEAYELVNGKDFIPFLELNRDPMLWAHVARFTETSYNSEYEVLEWMVTQHDCEAAIARDIWAHLQPEVNALGEDLTREWRAAVLLKISECSEGQGYPTGRLGSGFYEHDDLLDKAPFTLEWMGDARIRVPKKLLAMRLKGPLLDRRAYMVDYEGLHGRPSDFNLPKDFSS